MIIVTGMHRSGTSLMAMTLETLGVGFGDHRAFYAADQWNAKGYFERRDVMDLNSRMITGLDRTRSKVAALLGQVRYLSEPGLDRILSRGPLFADEMRTISDETNDGAIKDPRLCLTWSAWAEVVDVDAAVVCIRHPHEVADSLRRRQKIPMPIGLRFWRYHTRALRDRTPPGTVVVDLDSLMVAPGNELRLLIDGLGLEIDEAEAQRRFAEKYQPGLAKSTPQARPALDGETEELWEWLQSLRPIPIAAAG